MAMNVRFKGSVAPCNPGGLGFTMPAQLFSFQWLQFVTVALLNSFSRAGLFLWKVKGLWTSAGGNTNMGDAIEAV